MTRLLLALALLAAVIFGAMYATESWIFAFAPVDVDELIILYRGTHDRVLLTPGQAQVVLAELREGESYQTIDDVASQPDKYVVSHQLLIREGEQQRRYCVFLEQGLVTDSDYQNLRHLGERTKDLIASLRPRLPGQLDLVVPEYLSVAAGETIPYTRFILPVAYGAPDFRVYSSGSWDVSWTDQALVLAAWGERPGTGYSLQIIQVAVVDDWLRVSVRHASPEQVASDGAPSYPVDAVLVDRGVLDDLRGVCFMDELGVVFASQALGNYPVERQLTPWNGEQLPVDLPAKGTGVFTALVGDDQVQTLVVFLDSEAPNQPTISRIVEVAAGSFHVYVSYQPGESRSSAVLISGYGSSWRFRSR